MQSMQARITISTFAAIFFFAAWLIAGGSPLAAQEMPPPPRPAPEMERVKFLFGRWDYTETYEKNPMLPQGGVGRGTYTARPGPGGLSVISEFSGSGPVGEMSGTEWMLWDAKEKAYKTYGLSNYMPGMSVATGNWEGEKLVFHGVLEEGEMRFAMRYEYTEITPSSVTIFIFQGPVGGPMTKIVTTKATKRR